MKRTNTQVLNRSVSQNEQETPTMKKSRQGRRNDKQLSFLVDYMVQNPHVASGKFHTLNGKSNLAGSWEELVSNLNNLRNPGVKEKNIKSWKESWRDLKTKVSKKASALRNAKRQTGNKRVELVELSEIDSKVLGIVGFDYVEGTQCPDSWPEELPEDVEQLAKGNNSILNVIPTPLTIRPNHASDIYGNLDEINDDYYTVEVIGDNIVEQISEPLSQNITNESIPSYVSLNIQDQPSTSFTPDLFPDQSSVKPPIMSNISTKQPMKSDITFTNLKKKKYDVKLNTQLTNAREVFTNLANTKNQQLELLTSSLSMLAESNIQLAAAITKIAVNDERRLSVEEKLTTLLSTVISKLN